MKKTIIATIVGLLGFALLADSSAFTYQACLRDEKGNVIKDSENNPKKNHDIEIRLYNCKSGGVALWARKYSVMTDEKGLFNLSVTDSEGSQIGSLTSTLATVFKNNDPGSLFIGITVVGSSGEIVPRQCVYATPFAAMANDVRAVSGDLAIGGRLSFGTGKKEVVITKEGISQTGGSTTLQELSVNGQATVTGTLTAGNGVLSATVDGVTVKSRPLNIQDTQLQINGSEVVPVPVGGIIMWTKSTLPDSTHWAVCNGENGTPDLRARFVVGVGDGGDRGKYDYGDNGGNKSVALTLAQMPKHQHSYYFTGGDLCAAWKGNNNFYCQADHYKDKGNTRYTDYQGSGEAHENRPPYYALYYIMRIK